MKQSEQGIAKLAAALVAAQAELKAVAKDAKNPHFNSKFASLGAIIEEVRPVLGRHGLAIVQGATLPDTDSAGAVRQFTVETMLIHDSGEWLLAGIPMPLAKTDPQGAGSAMTYGRRYGLSALLSLNTDEDDDGNAASKQQAQSRPKAAAKPSPVPDVPQTVITRESKWPATPHVGVAVKDLPDDFLAWAAAPGRKLGPDTGAWQTVVRNEILARSMNALKVGV